MINTGVNAAADVKFAKQRNGYDREQVDRYINMLAGSYQTAYEQHKAISNKYNKLLADYRELEKQAQNNISSANVLSRALLDAEAIAQKIVEDARAEAEKIRGDAYIEKAAAKRSLETANESLAETISKLQSLMTVA